jgi:hypothetical protein
MQEQQWERPTVLFRASAPRRSDIAGIVQLVVNVQPNIRRRDYDRLKAILYNCAKNGPMAENRGELPNFRAYLSGRISYVAMIHPSRGERLQAMFERIDWGERAGA